MLPTAILVNVREEVSFEPEGDIVDAIRYGRLSIPEESSLWVVDGQHRMAGIQEAYDRFGTELDYDVPVVITAGIAEYDEMRLFHIVNSKAKSVPTDLAAELLRQAVLDRGRKGTVHAGRLSEKDFRKAAGAHIGRYLNMTPGPWQGKIRLPNEPRDVKRKPLQLNAVASSLDPALRDRFIYSQLERETDDGWPTLSSWVFSFWSALAQLMPEAFESIEEYTAQRTAGLYSFHLILPDVLDRCRERGSFTVGTMEETLKSLGVWVESGTWHREYGDPFTRSTGMASIRVLAEEMRKALLPLEVS
jgi:DGQHR domain-containing protein